MTEFEYGFSHSWVSGGTTQSDLPGLIRFAPFCNVEIRLGSDNLMQVSSDGATTRGIGDSWLTTEYEIRRQTRYFPAVAFSYGTKFPTANEGNGLGSGEYDHAFAFLVNKSVGKTVVTFNATRTLVGRPAGPGFDHSMFCARNFARPLRGRVGFTGEFYGASRLNAQTRGYAGTLWAVTHTMNPRFVLDGGVDLGLTAGIPHQRA
ncbi:MAG: hypothetical protein ACRD59_02110 [Candidatus Acidiferrales bacterium]